MSEKKNLTFTVPIILLTSILILIIICWGISVNARFAAVQKTWNDYNTKAAASYEAFSDISRHIGYGGFIHDFKNYVLRRDEKYVARIDADLINLFAALNRLDSLLTDPAEHAALAQLRATFEEYRSKYEIAKSMVAAGADSTAIDKIVKVDDTHALEARTILLRRIVAHSTEAKFATAHTLESASYLLYLGTFILIPIVAIAKLTHYFLRQIVSANKEVKAAHEQTDLLLETAPDPMLAVDADGCIRRANAMAVEYFGYSRQVLLGMKVENLLPERYRGGHSAQRATFLLSPTHRTMGHGHSLKTLLASGEERDVAISLSHFKVDEATLATVVLRDLTEQKKAEEELRLAASVFHNSAESVMITDAKGFIVSVNPAFTELTGYTDTEAIGQKPALIRSDRHGPEFYKDMWQTLQRDSCWQGEIWNRKKSGEAYLEWLTINRIDDSDGTPVRYVSVFHDITELRRKDESIRHQAFHDALTGLPNRALLQDRLQHAVERARRENDGVVVMFMDLDRFKAVNDNFGHDIGDILLQDVADRIKNSLRASDTLARLGGDEFVVLMEEVNHLGICTSIAEKIITAVSQPMDLRGHIVQVGASIGIASFPENGADYQELMKNADMAMYAAKKAGRNTYRIFQTEMLERPSPGASA